MIAKQKIHISNLQAKLSKTKTELTKTKQQLQKTTAKLMSYENIKDGKTLNFLTGVPTTALFLWILSLVRDKVNQVITTFSYENHLLFVLMKLKLGYSNKDLALRFNIKQQYGSMILRNWLHQLSNSLKHLIVWPSRESLRANLPKCFQSFKNCCCIIDCTEIFIERPFNLNARAQTYSNYKSHNTIKFLVGISPTGAVTFLSSGWGGRASDKEITLRSGFLDKVTYGDCVLADRGFLVEEELATRGAVLRIPAFTRGRTQMSVRDVDVSRQIAHVRIHVERVIGRLKKFHILSSIIPISQVDLIDDMMVTIAGIVNLNPSVVS